jgi:hypothetical protein
MDHSAALSKLRKPDQAVYKQIVEAYDKDDTRQGLKLVDQLLSSYSHHAG